MYNRRRNEKTGSEDFIRKHATPPKKDKEHTKKKYKKKMRIKKLRKFINKRSYVWDKITTERSMK